MADRSTLYNLEYNFVDAERQLCLRGDELQWWY